MKTIEPTVVTSELQVTKINNVSITAIDEHGKKLIPVKPICEALGIDPEAQRRKIYEDEILSSTTALRAVVAGDGKEREMLCLPIEYVFGWLFTINPKNVRPEAQEAVTRYKHQCYKALFEYFTEPQTFLSQKQEQMEFLVETYQEKQANFRNAKKEMDEAKKSLNKVMALTIDDWRANNRQLVIDFDDDSPESLNPQPENETK